MIRSSFMATGLASLELVENPVIFLLNLREQQSDLLQEEDGQRIKWES